jgi:iron complex transport system substrate-binding protein
VRPRTVVPASTPVGARSSTRPGARRTDVASAVALLAGTLVLTACGSADGPADATPGATTSGPIAVENCGERRTFDGVARRIVATSNSANVGTLLRIGAVSQLAAVSLTTGNDRVMQGLYGRGIERVPRLQSPISMEAILAKRPDVLVGSYSGLFAGSTGVTVESAVERGIAPYVISDSCRQDPAAGKRSKLGTMDPWDAVRADVANYGRLTGHEREATAAREELDRRLAALAAAPQAARRPKVLLFDSGTKDLYTSGRNGPPQGIIEAAGGRNVFDDQDTTWFQAAWERVAAQEPDAVVVMDYRSGEPGEVAQKLRTLRARPGLRDLPVIREDRIVTLPLALFTSGYPNIEAAERVRDALERFGLVPERPAAPATR